MYSTFIFSCATILCRDTRTYVSQQRRDNSWRLKKRERERDIYPIRVIINDSLKANADVCVPMYALEDASTHTRNRPESFFCRMSRKNFKHFTQARFIAHCHDVSLQFVNYYLWIYVAYLIRGKMEIDFAIRFYKFGR